MRKLVRDAMDSLEHEAPVLAFREVVPSPNSDADQDAKLCYEYQMKLREKFYAISQDTLSPVDAAHYAQFDTEIRKELSISPNLSVATRTLLLQALLEPLAVMGSSMVGRVLGPFRYQFLRLWNADVPTLNGVVGLINCSSFSVCPLFLC